MDIEKELFKNCRINSNKLLKYGFIQNNNNFIYEKNILDNSFRVIISIDNNQVIGKIIDLDNNLEYYNYRLNNSGSFSNMIKDEYKKILLDIRNKCFSKDYFSSKQTNRIVRYIYDKYQDSPEFLWAKYNDAVFRNQTSNKWYSIIMEITRDKITEGNDLIEVINVKLPRDKINDLLKMKGYYPAYHMNKKDWISIILDDTIKDSEICLLIDESYKLVGKR